MTQQLACLSAYGVCRGKNLAWLVVLLKVHFPHSTLILYYTVEDIEL